MTTFRPAGESDSDEVDEFEDFNHASAAHEATQSNGFGGHHGVDAIEPWRRKAFGRGGAPTSLFRSVATTGDTADRVKNAILANDVPAVERFLDEGFSVNYCYAGLSDSGSALVVASSHGYVDMVKLLLERRASLDADESGFTPLMAICMAKSEEKNLLGCARLLLHLRKKEVDVDQRQNQRMTALMFAARHGHSLLVQFLIDSGAKVDLQDSQGWTALCFAADQNHGHVVRVLLEAGADPDLATREGLTPSELASGGANQEVLRELIEKFEKRKSLLNGDRLFGVKKRTEKKFSDLDNVLMGLDLGNYMDCFEDHQVSLEIFLCLSEEDLQKMGIKEVGVRKKIISAISEIHKKDWEKSSLPRITPREKQKGIYFTCPDCVSIVANMGEHAKFLASCTSFIRKQLVEHPELLSYGQDIADVSQLQHHIGKCRKNLGSLAKSIKALDNTVRKLAENPNLQPVDLIKERQERVWLKCAIATTVIFAGVACVCLYVK